jgi:hypothetical protein
LGRVFDAAGSAQTPVRAQRIIQRSVGCAATFDAGAIPAQYFIEQAHLARMRNVSANPMAV